MKRRIINIVHVIILIAISIFINTINEGLGKLNIFQLEKMFELNLILLGVGISLISFLYSILVSIRNKVTQSFNNVDDKDFLKIIKSINLNIKRLVISLVILILSIIFRGVGIQFLRGYSNCDYVISIIKLSIFLYMIASVVDIVWSTLRLYEISFKID